MEKKNKRIQIAYFCINDPLDKRSWSGITYYLGQSLQKNVGDVHFLGPVELPRYLDKMLRALSKTSRLLFRKEYNAKHSFLIGLYTARILKRKLKKLNYDCIVAPAASTELSCLKIDKPVVYISDTTFKLISGYYQKEFRNISGFSKWEGNLLERQALRKSSLIIMSSFWAAHSASNFYKIPEQRITIMPFGANMDEPPSQNVIFEKLNNPVLTLLFLAVDWERKGGELAFETIKKLNEFGVESKLIVCGCIPPIGVEHPKMEVIPFLDKNKTADHDKFLELLSTSHFLILPTRADCSLLVACESNAYGMPAIATDTGGVSDVVKNGINGYCLPFDATGSDYATLIQEIYEDKSRFKTLIESSRKRYEEILNWDSWANKFKEATRTLLNYN